MTQATIQQGSIVERMWKRSVKETVIIVHGTWAAPESGKIKWYQLGQPFTAKLDAALQDRGSPARCWAHCHHDNEIFSWSGKNSWIERTRAASKLGNYVTKLWVEGWRCHIVAHSHGGNIVVEALPRITSEHSAKWLQGKIVTLGTPFMDTTSPILERVKRHTTILNALSWTVLAAAMFVILFFMGDWSVKPTGEDNNLFPLLFFLLCMLVIGLGFRRRSNKKAKLYADIQPRILAIGSRLDEAWQLLYHIRNIGNPFPVKENLLKYMLASIGRRISQRLEISRIYGQKSFCDLGRLGKLTTGFLHLAIHGVTVFSILFLPLIGIDKTGYAMSYISLYLSLFFCLMAIYLLVLILTTYAGDTFHSAFLSPYRRYARLVGSLGSVVPGLFTYIVRSRGWSILQEMTLGLEGYGFRPLPTIEQFPKNVLQNGVEYEAMPEGAVQRALDGRRAWFGRHLDGIGPIFSNLALTEAEIGALLRKVEADQSLVHAAYYTDDECIARVADWIAGQDDLRENPSAAEGVSLFALRNALLEHESSATRAAIRALLAAIRTLLP